jgi:ribonuclease P protein component
MLKRSFRLNKYEIKKLYKSGETRKLGFLVLRFALNRTTHFRAAIVISNSVLPKSVDRHRLKRKTIEILGKESLKNYDISLIFKKAIQENELKNAVDAILKDAKLVK